MAVIGMLLHIIAAGATIYFVFNKKTKNAINVAIFAGLIAGKFNVIFLNRFGKPLLFTLHYSSHPFPSFCPCAQPQFFFRMITWSVVFEPTASIRKNAVDFGMKRSRVKVTGQDCLQICFRLITPV